MHHWGTVDMRHGIVGPGFGCPNGLRFTAKGPQPKLEVNEPNDRFEQEADRVADEVIRMPDNPIPLGSSRDNGGHRLYPFSVSLQTDHAVQRLCKT